MKLLYPLAILAGLFLFSCTKDGGGEKASTSYDLAYGGPAGGSSGGSSGGPGGSGGNQPGVITAGEWNDLANWDFWLDLQNKDVFKDVKSSYRYNLAKKVSVRLLSSGNMPLIDEPVVLKKGGTILWEARTDNKGIAQLFIGKE